MEEVSVYFLDTYALIEIIKENKNYKKFQETINVTSLMNLYELHYLVSKWFGPEKADTIINKLKKIIVDIKVEDIKRASNFRIKNIKRKFSYIDCLGYSIALNRNIKFLTGDKEFENLESVEFVKK